jgi:hypothetical protein
MGSSSSLSGILTFEKRDFSYHSASSSSCDRIPSSNGAYKLSNANLFQIGMLIKVTFPIANPKPLKSPAGDPPPGDAPPVCRNAGSYSKRSTRNFF